MKHCTNNSPSIDRINNTLGYTKDNIAIISWKANRLKSDSSSSEELRKIANWMEKMDNNIVALYSLSEMG